MIRFNKQFAYTSNSLSENEPILLNLFAGIYLFQLWGAEGCYGTADPGRGAYVEGQIYLPRSKTLYLYLGAKGIQDSSVDSFNGGGKGDYGGDGATDIRIKLGSWDDFESLKSRIIIAAGGAGPDNSKEGGAGGCLSGFGGSLESQGGTQTSGGIGYYNGSFGKGGSHQGSAGIPGLRNGGGGGGYYGGATGIEDIQYGGGGGSSFISGHPGCNAILGNSTIDNIKHSNQSIHYSGLYFTHTQMIDGKTQMISPTGQNEVGHRGNGAAIITLLKTINESTPNLNSLNFHLICYIFVLISYIT